MKELPTVIASSVIRSTEEGDSHGGIYVIDFETEMVKQVVDWNSPDISWEGRGAERGLRGFEFYEGQIISAASDEIYFYDKDFKVIKSFQNKYLSHCHEIYREGDLLYISSTNFDAILIFNLKEEKFIDSFYYRRNYFLKEGYLKYFLNKLKLTNFLYKSEYSWFDPNSEKGPSPKDTNHINNVHVIDEEIFFSGRWLKQIYKVDRDRNLETVRQIPLGTHNVKLFDSGILYNHTSKNKICLELENESMILDIPTFEKEELVNDSIPEDHARQGFGRGLCICNDYIIGGSSPATVTLYSKSSGKVIKSITITKDVRNAIHGLEVFSV